MVNFTAYQAFARHWDSTIKNVFVIRDPETTGRWSMQIWDLDSIFQPKSVKAVNGELLPPRHHPVTRAMLDDPQIREMFGRRLQTLIAEHPRADLLASYESKLATTGQLGTTTSRSGSGEPVPPGTASTGSRASTSASSCSHRTPAPAN